LREQIKNGKPIVGAGAGVGLSAKFIEAGGADLIIICEISGAPKFWAG
jgi:predicted TIM-barrel enzyme